jgi:hypothetical protein
VYLKKKMKIDAPVKISIAVENQARLIVTLPGQEVYFSAFSKPFYHPQFSPCATFHSNLNCILKFEAVSRISGLWPEVIEVFQSS